MFQATEQQLLSWGNDKWCWLHNVTSMSVVQLADCQYIVKWWPAGNIILRCCPTFSRSHVEFNYTNNPWQVSTYLHNIFIISSILFLVWFHHLIRIISKFCAGRITTCIHLAAWPWLHVGASHKTLLMTSQQGFPLSTLWSQACSWFVMTLIMNHLARQRQVTIWLCKGG